MRGLDVHTPARRGGRQRRTDEPESGGQGLLPQRRCLTKIPHHGGNHIAAVAQLRRKIDARNPPPLDRARGRPARHAHAIHVQHETVVRGHADRQGRRYPVELQLAPEMQHHGRAFFRSGVGDPTIRILCVQVAGDGEHQQQGGKSHREWLRVSDRAQLRTAAVSVVDFRCYGAAPSNYLRGAPVCGINAPRTRFSRIDTGGTGLQRH